MNIGRYVNKRKICGEDETYQQDKKNQNKLTVRFLALDLPEQDRMIFNIYFLLANSRLPVCGYFVCDWNRGCHYFLKGGDGFDKP